MNSNQVLLSKHMTELQLQRTVEQTAATFGWLYFHDEDSRRNERGFPDLVIGKVGQPLYFVELKTEKGKLSDEQIIWREIIESISHFTSGVQYRLWRPRHWMDGSIETILRGQK